MKYIIMIILLSALVFAQYGSNFSQEQIDAINMSTITLNERFFPHATKPNNISIDIVPFGLDYSIQAPMSIDSLIPWVDTATNETWYYYTNITYLPRFYYSIWLECLDDDTLFVCATQTKEDIISDYGVFITAHRSYLTTLQTPSLPSEDWNDILGV